MMTSVTLPSGLWRKGVHHRVAWLRPLTGTDEEALCAACEAGGSPSESLTDVLARCVERLGDLERVEGADIATLTVGDREALLLHLRRLTLGERLQCVLDCPACGAAMDLDLDTSDLILPAYPDPRPDYTVAIAAEARSTGEVLFDAEAEHARCSLRFRLPTSADLAAVARLADAAPPAARATLLARCVNDVEGADTLGAKGVLAPGVAEALSEAMARLDPQAEINLDLACPNCAHRFAVLFDSAEFFLRELALHSDRLYREVHALALHYHWGEADILALPRNKRQRYLALLGESLGGAAAPAGAWA